MIKYVLTTLLFTAFLTSDNSYTVSKPIPTIIINDDDSDKNFRRRRGKGNKGRKRGGSGLR